MGNMIEISGLFDGGADSAYHTKQLSESVVNRLNQHGMLYFTQI